MKKYIYSTLIVSFTVFLFLGASCSSDQSKSNNNALDAITGSSFTLKVINQHNTPENCWIAINNKVYDVTNFIESHPGGDSILQGCGQVATDLFEEKDHSQRANELLADYYIGDLNNNTK
ncbi:cytochrome b5 domain-containing protein [Patescibacteria group bacterium]|nr:cytochrome b5 domain-containing protein [Patescibacteria group bacterium]MBU1672950.1 cytochrome b5 domain-containing protein [Patescibacteria group bacterium]